MRHDERVKHLLGAAARGELSRHDLFKRDTALGIGGTALAALTSAAAAIPAGG
jgi:hypothetical protein